MLRTSGKFHESSAGGETVRAFVPAPLPPRPWLELTREDQDLLEKANRALGRLDALTGIIPDTRLFISFYLRKEAVLSSQIEGTQSSLTDLLLYEREELPEAPLPDVVEISNYVAAMDAGLARLRGGFPLSLRLIREIHAILLRSGRGSEKSPGEFRRSQNWIGGTRPGNAVYVPPPPSEVTPCMGDLEKFLHDQPERTPALLKAGLAHAQFETIHPFLDGNGRVGRLLVTFLLCAEEVLSEPILYLSLFFKQHRDDYYDHLQRVRTDGDWEGWLRFFLEGVRQTANQAVEAAKGILALFESDRRRVAGLGRLATTALLVHEHMQRRPYFTITELAELTGLSFPTVSDRVQRFVEMQMVRELTGRRINRVFAYRELVQRLSEGTEPLS